MKLAQRMTLLTTGVACIWFAVAILIALWQFGKTGAAFERESMLRQIDRLIRYFDLKRMELDRLATDWAAWDDAYDFIVDRNSEFIESNLPVLTFRELSLWTMVFLDADAFPVWGASLVEGAEAFGEVLPGVLAYVRRDGPVWQRVWAGARVTGFAVVEGQPCLLAARTIVNSLENAPPRGVLVMVRRIGAQQLADAASILGCCVELTSIPVQGGAPAAGTDAVRRVDTTHVWQRGGVKGECRIADVHGHVALQARLVAEPQVSGPLMAGLRHVSVALLVAAGLFILLQRLLIHVLVAHPLRESAGVLMQAIEQVTRSGDSRLRVTEGRSDEIGDLAIAINRMLARLDTVHEEVAARRREVLHAQRLASLGTLVSGLAHEVGNPNNAVLLNAQVLSQLWPGIARILDDVQSDAGGLVLGSRPYAEVRSEIPLLLRETEAAAQRIAALVRDLKGFAGVSGSEAAQPIELHAAIRSALRLMGRQIEKSTTAFRAEFLNGNPVVRAHSHRLEQVVMNLVQNALLALPTPAAGVRVATEWGEDRRRVRLRVEDEGCGITPADREKIFDPFFTTRRETGGTGLGLAVTRTIVEGCGGTIVVDSTPGRGTRVTVELPVEQESDA